MRKELEKNYDPRSVEQRIYDTWLERGYFHAEPDESKKPFTIVIPPPNVTGQLHMGHAFDNTLIDILIRWKRMQGFNALWVPGTDHASISTEVKVVEKMAEEGLTKADVGREGFLERAWTWKEQYGGRIIEQLKRLGSSCDWDRERFTMDEGLSAAVTEVFLRLYEKGLIYRGEKLVNWCPKCRTTISDAEVDHVERESGFWHFKYPVKDSGEYLEFATTRPETMLGDTAIAVNPKDDRYAHLVGGHAVLPFDGREISIIADNYVEMDFGTGVVKITPAHDPNDFEVGERHGLLRINIMNDDGTINANGGKYEGLHKSEARARIVKDMEALGLFVKKETIKNAVGVHERCHDDIEPLMKLQWFVKMDPLAKPAVDAYTNGELNIIPERFGKIYLNWLNNIRDWCISRQLWWGHRIPAYYCDGCGAVSVAKSPPERCAECGCGQLHQDEDVLDTWFSSALWPFSTLGWPEKTPELDYFYPTSVLVTAYDIIFFWVVRMVFSGLEQMGELPFKDVLFHGLIRDAQGRKMSKSLGNGIDPLDVIEQYGADALRLSIVTGNSAGNDMRFHVERVEASRNFLNKIWNAARFMLMNFDGNALAPAAVELSELTVADKWILSRVNGLARDVTANLDNYETGLAASKIHDFIWDEYCDWYIEMVKQRLYNKEDATRNAALWTLREALIRALKLLHPFMPFITEELFGAIQDGEDTIMLSPWPEYEAGLDFPREERRIELIKAAVREIRNIRAQMNVPPSKKAKIFLVAADDEREAICRDGAAFFKSLAGAEEVVVKRGRDGVGDNAVAIASELANIYIPFAELVDVEKERARLEAETAKIRKELERARAKLENPGFVNKAPEAVVAEENQKAAKFEEMLGRLEDELTKLNTMRG